MFTKKEIMDRWAERQAQRVQDGLEPETDSFKLALAIANLSLFEEKQWNGDDYILHPINVAFDKTEAKIKQIVGILHDVVEDSDWELDDLRTVGFSERVIQAVDGVTSGKNEKYFEFVQRCSLSGPIAIDVKLKDLADNMRKNRAPSITMDEKETTKLRAYNISYYYLLAIKKGEIDHGTSVIDFIKTVPEYASEPAIVNDLMDRFSDKAERLPIPNKPSSGLKANFG